MTFGTTRDRKSGLALSLGNIMHPLAAGASYLGGFKAGWDFELHTDVAGVEALACPYKHYIFEKRP